MNKFFSALLYMFHDLVVPTLVAVLIAALLVMAINTIESKTCHAKTADMGFPVQYSFFSGCRIKVEGGRWIPLDSYYYKQP